MLKAISGRRLAVCLGVLWLIDGLAQLQPKMFTKQFASHVISPSALGQPIFVRGPIDFAVHVFLMNPALFNSLILVIQLSLGILILTRITSRLGLWLSIPWALFVWVIGEGYGGLFGFNNNLMMGLPGAAILYALLALVALKTMGRPKAEDANKGRWLIVVWAVVWILGGIYQLLPGQNSLPSFISMISATPGQPGWLYSFEFHIAKGLSGLLPAGSHAMTGMMSQPAISGGYWLVIAIALIEIVIGLAVFMPSKFRIPIIYLGILCCLFFWLIGQTLGGFYSGLATDPNTGPLLIIVGLVILGFSDQDGYLRSLYKKVESLLV